MAIDPSISLGVRIPQINLDIPSPIQQFGQMLSLRGLMEQQQLRKMQIAQEQMQLDALKTANAGQQEFRRRMMAGENLTPGQSYGILGSQQGSAFLKAQSEIEEQNLKTRVARSQRLGSLAGSASDTPSFNRAILQAHSEGLFDDETARQMLAHGYNPKLIQQFQAQAMTALEQDTSRLKQLEYERANKEAEARMASENAQARLRGFDIAAQSAPDDPALWPAWREQMKQAAPQVMGFIPEQHSTAGYQLVKQLGIKPTVAQPGRDIPYSPEVQAQKIALAEAAAPKTPSVGMTREAEEQAIRIARAKEENKPPTAAENQTMGFYRRMKDAEDTLGTLEKHMLDMGLFGQAWYNKMPNWAQSSNNKVLRQAQREFTEARLRKESGAAIADAEYEKDALTYFPQPGDDERTLARKKAARRVVMDSFKQQAGRAYKEQEEVDKRGGGGNDPEGLRGFIK